MRSNGKHPLIIPQNVWVLGIVSLLMDLSSEMILSILPIFLVTGLGVSVLTLGLIGCYNYDMHLYITMCCFEFHSLSHLVKLLSV